MRMANGENKCCDGFVLSCLCRFKYAGVSLHKASSHFGTCQSSFLDNKRANPTISGSWCFLSFWKFHHFTWISIAQWPLPSDQHLIFSSIWDSGSLTRLKAPRRTEHTNHTLDNALTWRNDNALAALRNLLPIALWRFNLWTISLSRWFGHSTWPFSMANCGSSVIGRSPCRCCPGTFQAGPQGLEQRRFQQDFLRHLDDDRRYEEPCRMILWTFKSRRDGQWMMDEGRLQAHLFGIKTAKTDIKNTNGIVAVLYWWLVVDFTPPKPQRIWKLSIIIPGYHK